VNTPRPREQKERMGRGHGLHVPSDLVDCSLASHSHNHSLIMVNVQASLSSILFLSLRGSNSMSILVDPEVTEAAPSLASSA